MASLLPLCGGRGKECRGDPMNVKILHLEKSLGPFSAPNQLSWHSRGRNRLSVRVKDFFFGVLGPKDDLVV